MDAAELRAIQAPLKQAYRDAPESAVVTSQATGTIDQAAIACQIETPHGRIAAGLHQAAGGTGLDACSADMLLEALIACAGVTLAAVATAMGVTLRGGSRVSAQAHWDARGTLAIDKTAPIGLTDITLNFALDTDADTATIARLIASTERYCVILQTLRAPPRLVATVG